MPKSKKKPPLDRALAFRAVRRLCRSKKWFISEEIWKLLGSRVAGRELRHLGLVMLEAQRRGWCKRTEEYVVVPRCHNLIRPVWRSLLYEVKERAAGA